MPRNENSVTIRRAQILFRNFSGRQTPYNNKGDRNFCVLLNEADALALHEAGWNVKATKPREEGDEPEPYIKVTVNFEGYRPPKVVLITNQGKNRTDLSEDMVDLVDKLEIDYVDLIVRPYQWKVGDNSGITAYLKSIFVVVDEDELDLEYADAEYAQRPPMLEE